MLITHHLLSFVSKMSPTAGGHRQGDMQTSVPVGANDLLARNEATTKRWKL
jgi:hypothetical protein